MATFFLLLYLFIAMPVQLWHHHAVSKETSCSSKILKPAGDDQSEVCKICQHTYAAYVNDETRYEAGILFFFPGRGSLLTADYPSPFVQNDSNKGPPSRG